MDERIFIKLYCKLTEWGWHKDPNTLSLFIHILLIVNHFENPFEEIMVMPGQKVTSIDKLSNLTGLSHRSVRTSLNRLKSTGELTIKTTNKYTLVTVVNWALYQPDPHKTTSTSTSNLTNERQTNDKRTTTNRDYKKERSIYADKKPYGSFSNVMLTDEEYSKLYVKRSHYIEALSEYKQSKGKKYKDDYATILGWMRKDGVSNTAPVSKPIPIIRERTEESDRIAARIKEAVNGL